MVDVVCCFVIGRSVRFHAFLRRLLQEQRRCHDGARLSLTTIRWLLRRAAPSSGLVALVGQWLMGRTGAAESAVGCCHHCCRPALGGPQSLEATEISCSRKGHVAAHVTVLGSHPSKDCFQGQSRTPTDLCPQKQSVDGLGISRRRARNSCQV